MMCRADSGRLALALSMLSHSGGRVLWPLDHVLLEDGDALMLSARQPTFVALCLAALLVIPVNEDVGIDCSV